MSTNYNKPHMAILQIKLDVMSILDTGECDGKPLSREELSMYGIKPTLTKTINGFDKNDCLIKLKQLLDSIGS